MTDDTIAAPTKSKPTLICDELHTVAARLAGVASVLRSFSDNVDGETGNALHLMLDIVADANSRICIAADRVSNLRADDVGAQS
jgi:hypothetical protein